MDAPIVTRSTKTVIASVCCAGIMVIYSIAAALVALLWGKPIQGTGAFHVPLMALVNVASFFIGLVVIIFCRRALWTLSQKALIGFVGSALFTSLASIYFSMSQDHYPFEMLQFIGALNGV